MPRRADTCVNVLGVPINVIDIDTSATACERLISQGRGYVCVTGVHGVMEAQRDARLRSILSRSFLTVPDGMPLVWIGRLRGWRAMKRVYGPDLMLELCRRSVTRGYCHFLYGGNQGVAEELADCLRRKVPGLRIVGTYTPPFRSLNSTEESELRAQVAACKPDIIWVGLSTPKQEIFMARYLDELDTRLMVGVGAAFDVHTGRLKDAPRWMKGGGLQWLHRLIQEPRRLSKRYLVNNPRFIVAIVLQLAGISKHTMEL